MDRRSTLPSRTAFRHLYHSLVLDPVFGDTRTEARVVSVIPARELTSAVPSPSKSRAGGDFTHHAAIGPLAGGRGWVEIGLINKPEVGISTWAGCQAAVQSDRCSTSIASRNNPGRCHVACWCAGAGIRDGGARGGAAGVFALRHAAPRASKKHSVTLPTGSFTVH